MQSLGPASELNMRRLLNEAILQQVAGTLGLVTDLAIDDQHRAECDKHPDGLHRPVEEEHAGLVLDLIKPGVFPNLQHW
jgi:hypothetical protein